MLNYQLKIGLVPDVRHVANFENRKGMFEPEKGVENKNHVIEYLKANFQDEKTQFCDFDWLNEYGLLYKNTDCVKVCEYL